MVNSFKNTFIKKKHPLKLERLEMNMSNDELRSQEPKKDYLMSDATADVPQEIEVEDPNYKPAEKLKGKNTIVTGGDSGIGQATAIAFAKEGANVAIVYYENDEDADKTKNRLEEIGVQALAFKGDVGNEEFAIDVVKQVADAWGQIDVHVNHAGEQHVQEKLQDVTAEQIDRTFRTNVYSMYYFVKAVYPHMPKGGSIINTASITAYQGNPLFLDYSATNGAIVSFTRSLSQHPEILEKEIRVNGVAPGPIMTPMIPATFDEEKLKTWGKSGPFGRPGKAYELAGAYVYLACSDSSYVSGQVLHVDGGEFTTS